MKEKTRIKKNTNPVPNELSSEFIINLCGTWDARIPSKDLNLSIEIPGDLATALVQSHKLPHPYPGKNELDFQWIGHSDWSMRTSFSLPEGNHGPQAHLILEQLDTFATVYINGNAAGTSENMFVPLELDIGALLHEGENEIRIDFQGAEKRGAEEARKLPYPIPSSKHFSWASDYRNLVRKVQCHGGWDWGPAIMTSGIYGGTYIRLGGAPRVSSFSPQPRPSEHFSSGNWTVDIELTLHSREHTQANADITLLAPDGTILEQNSLSLELKRGENPITHTMQISSPQLWWPAGEGGQPLYGVELSIGGEIHRRKIGFRHIEVIHQDDDIGRSMKFRVNGREIFAKGANWIPTDALPSYQDEEKYRNLLEDAREGNMNMIRVWGGGQYESELFYDLCDELGLLVWQDMMFACAMYPATSDFLKTVEPEIRYQVQRLKHRTCLAIWCGNNEDLGALSWYEESRANPARYLVDYDRLNEGVVGRIVRELDPSRTWWPSSPSAGIGDYSDNWHDDSKGDMHYWSVWHEGKSFEAYYEVTPRFCSEFGFQSFPSLETVKSFASEDEWNISSPVMRHHQRNDMGNSIILSTMSSYFRIPEKFEDQLYVSQVQQAMAIRTAVDYWRSRRPVSMGALYWQLNDNWPVASWSSIEYGGRWKVLHYDAKRFFAPFTPALYAKDGRIHCYLLNDSQETLSGTMLIRRISFSGEILESTEVDAEVNGLTAMQVWEHPEYQEGEASNSFLHAKWTARGHSVEGAADIKAATDIKASAGDRTESSTEISTSMFLSKPRDCYLKPAEIRIRQGSGPEHIVLESNVPAFYVLAELPGETGLSPEPEVSEESGLSESSGLSGSSGLSEESGLFKKTRLNGHFSDGGFTLLPGEPKELKYTQPWSLEKGDRPEVKITPDMVRIRHLRQTY